MKRSSRAGTPKPGQPVSDAATYRDLLLFEERLKTNAARLNRRKRKYQFLLFQLILSIFILASDVLLDTNWLTWPLNHIVRRFPVFGIHEDIIPPPYITQSVFCIAVITLLLFYASGLYAEKIGYANRYVPHANKALRSFNMYLNVRSPPLQPPWPLSLILPASSESTHSTQSPSSPPPRGRSEVSPRGRRTTTITPIPPSTNPRGELIFTSRVDKHFRESYEKYRSAFEKRRDERVLAEAAMSPWAKILRWIPGSQARAAATLAARRDFGLEKDGRERTPGSSRNPSRSVTPIDSAPRAPS